jgi:hypothetical protein
MVKMILLSVVLALAISGCATDRRQAVEVSRAQSLVDQAEQAGAQQYAAADLEAARNKLQQANNGHTDHEDATRLASEAAIDAQVASARTQAAKAQLALNQVNAGSETLRQETTAGANAAGETVPQGTTSQANAPGETPPPETMSPPPPPPPQPQPPQPQRP